MAWVVSVFVDQDKTAAPQVGSATAVFTDTDNSVFTYSQRAVMTAANSTAFANAAIAARNAWQSKKNLEVTAMTSLVNSFTTAGEVATAGDPT